MGLTAGGAPKTVLVVDDTDDRRYLTAPVEPATLISMIDALLKRAR